MSELAQQLADMHYMSNWTGIKQEGHISLIPSHIHRPTRYILKYKNQWVGAFNTKTFKDGVDAYVSLAIDDCPDELIPLSKFLTQVFSMQFSVTNFRPYGSCLSFEIDHTHCVGTAAFVRVNDTKHWQMMRPRDRDNLPLPPPLSKKAKQRWGELNYYNRHESGYAPVYKVDPARSSDLTSRNPQFDPKGYYQHVGTTSLKIISQIAPSQLIDAELARRESLERS